LKKNKNHLNIEGMAKKKETYLQAANKIAVREFLFSHFKFNTIVGLAGPDINEYLAKCKKNGFKDIIVYERDLETAIKQMQIVDNHNFQYKIGDILHADPDLEDTLYDLDYCVTARYMKEHIAKFKKNFIMTFSRRIKDVESIATFFKTRGEKVVKEIVKQSPIFHTVYKTHNGGIYIYTPYHDTSNMFCIAKIK
jgi:hypothetical protein